MIDVAVLGAGLAGLSAARDLARGGADVVVLEARERPGGRVEAVALPDGRVVQAGGEVFGASHDCYRRLVDELGLAVEPSYVVDPGQMSWGLTDGVYVGDEAPWMSDAERADEQRIERAFTSLAETVDPDDPWGHPDASRLDRLSLAAWLREQEALPAVIRRHELAFLSLSCDGPERISLLAQLRKHASQGGRGFYDLAEWEGLRVSAGSAAVAQAMADELGPRVRLCSVVTEILVRSSGCTVVLDTGERIDAEAVVCAIPAGPLRSVRIAGVSDRRLASLRAQRHALAAKVVAAYEEPFWQRNDQNGLAETEWLFGSSWPQAGAVLSMLVPPERFAPFVAAPPLARRETVLDGLRALYGEQATEPVALIERAWGADPWTLGYIASWAPGDLDSGRAAARHPRASVLRRRLRSLGGRLHGGCGQDRPCRGGCRRGNPGRSG